MFKNIFLKCEPTFWLTHNMKQIESSKQVTLHITNNLNKSQITRNRYVNHYLLYIKNMFSSV